MSKLSTIKKIPNRLNLSLLFRRWPHSSADKKISTIFLKRTKNYSYQCHDYTIKI
jgi:hypothetical protein